MKTNPLIGLIGAGGVSRSFLSRMPAMLRHVGPVKAASYRVARRIANSLRAGHAITRYDELDECDQIWIAVPESDVDRITRDLASAISLAERTVVVADTERDSLWPGPLLAAGARVATLNVVEESRERLFAAEGDPDVIRALRRLAAADGRKLVELRAASKPLYSCGVNLAAHLVLPWIAAAVESLRDAGFSRSDASHIASALAARALRSYGKAGRKAWSIASTQRLHASMQRDLETIRATDPKLAALYSEGIAQALRYFDSKPAL